MKTDFDILVELPLIETFLLVGGFNFSSADFKIPDLSKYS